MYVGADYYPEHWPQERWEKDAELMQQAHFNITRVAEFSWIKLEPMEGQYDFKWLDEAIETLGKRGVKVIMCTPTPTMPKWLYDKYPEVIAEDKQGNKIPFGNRQSNCFTSGSYQLLSERITKELAKHYKDNPNVVGWQLDNELWGPYCYCNSCENAFRDYLRKKYKTIENLNETYGTIFWSQCYRDFSEVHLPRHESSNPSLDLDFKRFHSDHIIDFAARQAQIIRQANPNHFITHNTMGFVESINYYKLAEILDFVSYDYYYNFGKDTSWENRLIGYNYGAAVLDLTRSFKHKNFWIMENTAGANGWETYGRNVRPGELRRMTLQNYAHGIDGQVWFRWRTCRYGTEQYWHGLLGHDGIPARRYNEAKDVSEKLHELDTKMGDSTVESEVAIMFDYDDLWTFSLQKNSDDFSFTDLLWYFHAAFAKRGVNVEFISPKDDFSKYKVLCMPAKYVLTKTLSDKVEDYAKNGGHVVTTFRSGVKDEYNIPYAQTLPGLLRDMTGIKIEEYESVSTKYPYEIKHKDKTMQGTTLCDWIIPESAEVIATYSEIALKDYAAATVNNFGKGKVYYMGIQSLELLDVITDLVIDSAKLANYGLLPKGIEVVTRSDKINNYIFVLNHSDDDFTTTLQNNVDEITVKSNDVAIITVKK